MPDVENEVIDKLNYIEETKETMDKNTGKLAEIVESISGIHKGKTIQDEKIKFHLLMCVFSTEEEQWYV